jgi:hypothetical protein
LVAAAIEKLPSIALKPRRSLWPAPGCLLRLCARTAIVSAATLTLALDESQLN